MSQEFAQNWVMDGGVYKYTGASTSTNRSAKLYNNTELNIANKTAVVTMNGSIEGQGDLEINGEGTLTVNTTGFFKYDGNVVVKGGTVRLNNKDISSAGIGSASKLVMQGGTFVTVGKNEATVTYNFPIEASAGTSSTVDFDLWNTNKCKVSGTGTLIWNVHYLREYIEGNWDNYTGQLIVNGTGKAGSSQFAIRNGVGVKNATLYLKGTATVNGAKNASTFYLGGLSGDATTALSGFNVKAKGEGTWVVGGANTDETFRGVIDDKDQAGTHPGKTSIVKEGTGDWRLTGSNTYSGTTQINAGTLIVNGTHSGTGAVTVNSGATLAGTGTLAGKVTVKDGGCVASGDTLVTGTQLKLNGGLTVAKGGIVEIPLYYQNSLARANAIKGTLTINDATLVINLDRAAAIPDNQKFTVFSGSLTGTGFVKIEPERPSETQVWDTSELMSNGYLYVRNAATGIHDVNGASAKDAPKYNLQGQRIEGEAKGLFIQNGKIVVKK